jgi:NAD(P)-dependent dehydrogenase (short-subunit alcohol dehydrogenase family)
MEQRFAGKTALITGAASGIGAACAQRLAAEGARVAVLDINDEGAAVVADKIRGAGGDAFSLAMDVTKSEQVAAAFEETKRRFGRLDVMLANAGVTPCITPVGDCPEESWRRVLDVNLTGVFFCVKAALPIMRRQRKGVILATSSVAGLTSTPAGIEYNVSKTGVIMLIRHIAQVYGPEGIRSVAICPGWVDTPFLEPVYDAFGFRGRSILRNYAPLGRMATPDDIAAAVAFVASDEASFISGIAFPIDGGALAGSPIARGPLIKSYLTVRAGLRRLRGKPTAKLMP